MQGFLGNLCNHIAVRRALNLEPELHYMSCPLRLLGHLQALHLLGSSRVHMQIRPGDCLSQLHITDDEQNLRAMRARKISNNQKCRRFEKNFSLSSQASLYEGEYLGGVLCVKIRIENLTYKRKSCHVGLTTHF